MIRKTYLTDSNASVPELVEEIIELTNKDEIPWSRDSYDHYWGEYKGIKMGVFKDKDRSIKINSAPTKLSRERFKRLKTAVLQNITRGENRENKKDLRQAASVIMQS